ncbi:MAG: ABC transporter, partial [Eubacteriaceae bacterium]|nr:ABC transporter [Eubacteriaceae bacterium]
GEMAADILLNEKDPGTVPVMTFDNGTATVNTEICEKIGVTYDDMAELFGPLCQEVKPIQTSESF